MNKIIKLTFLILAISFIAIIYNILTVKPVIQPNQTSILSKVEDVFGTELMLEINHIEPLIKLVYYDNNYFLIQKTGAETFEETMLMDFKTHNDDDQYNLLNQALDKYVNNHGQYIEEYIKSNNLKIKGIK